MKALLVWTLVMISAAALGAETRTLTQEGAEVSMVSLSPDGALALFLLHREGGFGNDVAVMDLASGKLTNLTREAHPEAVYSEMESGPQLSSDGKWVFYAKEQELWKVPLAGGKAEQVFADPGLQGFLVEPKSDSLLMVVERWVEPKEIKVVVDATAISVRVGLIERLDLKTGKRTIVSRRALAENGTLKWTPDGRILFIGNVGGGREIVVMSAAGKAKSLGPALFNSFPVFLDKGKTMVFLDQVSGKGPGFDYPQPTWSAKTLKKGKNLELPLPEGTTPGSMWSMPGYLDLVVAAGNYDTGYKLYRYDGAKKSLTLIVDQVFGTADGGGVTPDGKAMLFQGGGPGVSRGPLMKVTF